MRDHPLGAAKGAALPLGQWFVDVAQTGGVTFLAIRGEMPGGRVVPALATMIVTPDTPAQLRALADAVEAGLPGGGDGGGNG
jgi:hypothetical protein